MGSSQKPPKTCPHFNMLLNMAPTITLFTKSLATMTHIKTPHSSGARFVIFKKSEKPTELQKSDSSVIPPKH